LSDKFLEQIGEIAVGFARLEDLLTGFLLDLCDSPKAAVFTKGMGFEMKCQKIEALMKLDPDQQKAEDVRKWVNECRIAAGYRNDALHSRHTLQSVPAQWLRISDGKENAGSAAELVAINAQITDLYWRGSEYWNQTKTSDRMSKERPDDNREDL
jgi:hypothetical protein